MKVTQNQIKRAKARVARATDRQKFWWAIVKAVEFTGDISHEHRQEVNRRNSVWEDKLVKAQEELYEIDDSYELE